MSHCRLRLRNASVQRCRSLNSCAGKLRDPDQLPNGARDNRVMPPLFVRPTINLGCSPAHWSDFLMRWNQFRNGSNKPTNNPSNGMLLRRAAQHGRQGHLRIQHHGSRPATSRSHSSGSKVGGSRNLQGHSPLSQTGPQRGSRCSQPKSAG